MENWSAWIGRTMTSQSYLDPMVGQKMQVTLNRTPTLVAGDLVPPAWHWLYFAELTNTTDLGIDGHTRLGLTLPDFPLPRRMWAGGKITWLNELRFGDDATRVSKILNIEQKSGKSGDLIFLTMQHEISQSQKICIREEQNIVYRAAVSNSKTTEPEPAPTDSEFANNWKPNEVMLFRYSALTFNSHRIHYDADYAREAEGYPGVIVHGPLLATLLLDLAVSNHRPVNEFTYRAKSPITLPHSFSTHGKTNSTSTELWVATDQGSLAMQAQLN